MQYKLLLSALVSTAFAQGLNLTAALAGNSNLSALTNLLQGYPAVVQALSGASNITLLAPSNNALNAFLNSSVGQAAASNPGLVQALLTYHVLNGSYPSSSITNTSTFVRTLLTNSSYTNVTSGQRLEAIALGNNVTLFSGNFDNSTVSTANINFTGGVIHVINRLLTLPPRLETGLINADLRSLYGVLNSTNLLNTVSGLSNVTIFAPRNQAFQAIASAFGNGTAVNQTMIQNILQYHVVQSTNPYYSTRLTNNTSLQTLQGTNLTIHTGTNGTFVNGAKVVAPNFLIAGGVVHIIDNVLNPSNTTAAAVSATTGAVAFSGASSVGSDIPFTSGVTTRSTSIGGGAASATATARSTSTSSAAAMPQMTGAVAKAALFGAGAAGAWAVGF